MKLREEIINIIDICFPDEMDSSMYHPNTEVGVDKILQLFKTFLEENKLEEKDNRPEIKIWLQSKEHTDGFNQAIKEQFEKNMKELE